MTRKLLTLVLSLLLILGAFSYAMADEEHSEPILFRGASWGSNYSDVQIVLPDGVKMRDLDIREYWYPMMDMMYDGSGYGNQVKAEIGCYAYARTSSLKGIKVAGYEIEQIYLYFVFVPDETGKLVKDPAHTAFISGQYKIEPKDPDAVFDDLVTKLSSLYGDVDVEESSEGIIDRKMALWKGADGTMVSIFKQDYSSGTHEIYIKYGTLDGDRLIDEAYAAAVKEENEGAASNTDGL